MGACVDSFVGICGTPIELEKAKAAFLEDVWPTVLLVEDDEDQVMMFELFLRGHGLCVVSASSTEEAYFRLSNQPIDIVVSDLCFPGVDGIQFLQDLKSHRMYGGRKPAQIIAITACPDNLRQAALSQVADMYCEKRNAKHLLLEQIKQLLSDG
jgi:CheY-like chemotaxis protein